MADEPSWCRKDASGWTLSVHAQPGAKKSEITGLHGGSLKIRIASPPVEGRANEALIAFLAKALSLPRASLRVVRGASSRRKEIHIAAPAADPGILLRKDP